MKLLRQTFTCAIVITVSVSALAEEPSPLPDAAKRLQQAYRQSIEAAIKPIRVRYIADLKKLQEQSMKAGKLTDAVALNQEIASFAISSIFGEWSSENMRLHIRPDHTATYTNGNTATWEIKGGELVLRWKNGDLLYTYSIPETGDTLHGKRFTAEGKAIPLTATRIK